MTFVLLVAGNETTRGLLRTAGQAAVRASDQRRLLVDDPSLRTRWRSPRYQSPVTHSAGPRSPTPSSTAKITAGRLPHHALPRREPRRRDLGTGQPARRHRRPDPGHLAFGFAEHFCLGASLARREIRLVLGELLRRYPNYELVGEPEHVHMTPGIKRMPVVFHPVTTPSRTLPGRPTEGACDDHGAGPRRRTRQGLLGPHAPVRRG